MHFHTILIKPIIATVVISFFYLIGSILFVGSIFYFFDLIWRVSIIWAVIFIAKYKLRITKSQWFQLLILFIAECMVYQFFTTLPITRIFISVMFAPILEELFFRGWMIDTIKGSHKQKILISSLLFGLYHLKNFHVLTPGALLYQIIYATFFVGPLFAYLKLRYNSLFIPIMLHSANNAFADIITSKVAPFITKRQPDF